MIKVIFINNLQGRNYEMNNIGIYYGNNFISNIKRDLANVECDNCDPQQKNVLEITFEKPGKTEIEIHFCCDSLKLKVLQKSPSLLRLVGT